MDMKNLSQFIFVLSTTIFLNGAAHAQSSSVPAAASKTDSVSNATGSQPELTKLPAIAVPRLASIHIRIDDETIRKESAFAQVGGLRSTRDDAMRRLAAIELRGKVSAHELGKVADAVNAVNAVCAIGTDYIQLRLKKNSSRQFMFSLLTGFFGVATAAAPVVSTAKVAGIAGLASSSYKTDVVEDGDTGRSNAELRKVLEDVRVELASGIQNYNRALLMSQADDGAQLTQFRHLQAAVFEMHAACAYF